MLNACLFTRISSREDFIIGKRTRRRIFSVCTDVSRDRRSGDLRSFGKKHRRALPQNFQLSLTVGWSIGGLLIKRAGEGCVVAGDVGPLLATQNYPQRQAGAGPF
jgi:hypothetical protein